MVLMSLAVAPAVIEELCFRGYLFSALGTVMGPARHRRFVGTLWAISRANGKCIAGRTFFSDNCHGAVFGMDRLENRQCLSRYDFARRPQWVP